MNLESIAPTVYPEIRLLSKSLNRPLYSMLVTAFIYVLLIIFRLAALQGDPSAFIVAGSRFVRPDISTGISVLKDSYGYDGQFYYRLALEPFTSERGKYGIAIDFPRYRQQRILYPLVVNLLSLGDQRLVPSLMIFVNFISLLIMGYLGGQLVQQYQRHALYGVIFPLYAGFFLSFARDLAEVIELTLILGALLCLSRRKDICAALLLSLAILSKETALLVAVGVLTHFVFAPSEKRPKFYVFAIPILIYVLWQYWLNFHWHQSVSSAVQFNLGFPFAGLLEFLRVITSTTGVFHQLYFVEVVVIILTVLITLLALRTATVSLAVKVSWFLYIALAISLTRNVWVEDWAFLRALSELYVLSMAIILSSTIPLQRWLAGLWTCLSTWVCLVKAPIP